MRQKAIALLAFCVSGALFIGGCETETETETETIPLIPGQCGMEGMLVECNVGSDCPDKAGYEHASCSVGGECHYTRTNKTSICENEEDCPPGYLCMGNICIAQCFSHRDCRPYGFCDCGYPICDGRRCEGTECPEGFEPEPGTLRCLPAALEGDCHTDSAYDPCPDGYERVGERGCVRME